MAATRKPTRNPTRNSTRNPMKAPAPAPTRPTGMAGLLALAREAPGLTALALIAVAGIAISIYLTTVHYTKVPLICPANSIVNCAVVTSSAYSVVPGTSLPITIPGILWFLVSGALAVVALRSRWRAEAEPPRLRAAHFIWAALGLLFVLYLVYAEIVLLHKICEWCTIVHLLTLATFLLALMRLQQEPEYEAPTRSARVR